LLRPERMEMSDIDVGVIIDRVVEHRRKLADENEIEVLVRKSTYRLVRGNASGLEQVVANLLNNALQYTPSRKNGKITITLEPDYKSSILLAVADNGVGIDGKDLFHIFEPFYRADLSRTRRVRHSGSGLGLAIVSEIVRAHKGKINVQSAIGKGTTVTVTLPSGAAPDGIPHPSADKQNTSEVSVDFSKGT
jgi:signal transduction histidine kinase